MARENRVPQRSETRVSTAEVTPPEQPSPSKSPGAIVRRPPARSKLSVNVSHAVSERLRSLAYDYRLSESSIVEVALTIFFERGDDALLGVLLRQLGATLRSK
jgi:hypothetical protein